MNNMRINNNPYELTDGEFKAINGFFERNDMGSFCGLSENIALLNDDFQGFFSGLPKAIETLATNGGHGKFIEGLTEVCSHLTVFMKMKDSLNDLNILARAIDDKVEERLLEQMGGNQAKRAV